MPALHSSPCAFYSRLINYCLQLLKYLSFGNLTDLWQLLSHSFSPCPYSYPPLAYWNMTQQSFYLVFLPNYFYSRRFYFIPSSLSQSFMPFMCTNTHSTYQSRPSWAHCHFLDNTSFPVGRDEIALRFPCTSLDPYTDASTLPQFTLTSHRLPAS